MSLSRGLVRLLATVCGVTIASIYYAQPLLHTIARAFGASQSAAGLVATSAQAGFAAGLLLIVPLGDITPQRPLFTAILPRSQPARPPPHCQSWACWQRSSASPRSWCR